MGELLYQGQALQYQGQDITYNGAPEPVDPYAPWGGFSNWLRLRFLEYV